MQKIILITIFLSMISCSFNEGPSYDELRDQEGSKAFDQFITSSKGKELKKYVMNIDQLLKEAEELTDTTMMKDTTLPILHHSLTSYRKSLRLTHKEFMIKKNTIMIELASVNKTFGTLKNLTEDNTYKSLNYWTVKDTNNLYKYNKKAFADIIDPKKFKYLIVHKQLKYIKPKEDTTAHEALLFPNFFAGSYEGVVYIYDLTQNKLVAQSTFSATNSEKVEKDKDSWDEEGEKLYALPYISSLKIDLKFEIRKKLFRTIDNISGYQ